MKNLLYTIAKAIVDKHSEKSIEEKEKAETKRLQAAEEKRIHDKLIVGFRNRYIGEVSDEFKKNTTPGFKIGDTAITHWYGEGSRWDGSVQSLQSHTPFRGPLTVEITGVHLDTAELEEFINQMNERDSFSNIDVEHEYPEFKSMVKNKTYLPELHWSYTIKVPGDENKYWCYTWRENKLLDPKSDEARWSKKAFKNEKEYKSLKEESDALREKIRKQVERVTGTHVIVR